MHSTRSCEGKILARDQIFEIRTQLARDGLTLVQCHGCFDIVHPGHIRHLQFAASQGDRLIVSITPDEFVNKGPNRPMFSHGLRAENLAALAFVDWVYIHTEPTAADLLASLKPDIYIKGAEYASKHDPRFEDERAIVEGYNGRVVFSSGDVVFSSSSIVESIQRTSRPDPDLSGLSLLAQKHDLSTVGMRRAFDSAGGKRVVVVGETILDTYTQCQWPEIAEEHPMLSLRPVSSREYDGGAAVIALHLASMGARPVLCTPIPKRFDSSGFLGRMAGAGVEVIAIDVDGEMPEKKRFLVDHEKVMKLDCTRGTRLDSAQRTRLVDQLRGWTGGFDGMILADFGLGMFREGLSAMLIAALRGRVGYIAGDVSGIHGELLNMRGVDVLCPCEGELRRAMNDDDSPIGVVAHRALESSDAGAVVVTRGSNGLVIVSREDEAVSLPAMSQDPIDPLGCGDALLAGMSFAILGGASLVQASFIGSVGASVAGAVMGNVPVSDDDMLLRAQALGAQFAHVLSSCQHIQAEPKPAAMRARASET